MPQFSHLHCHTQYSLLDGAANIDLMFKKAQQDKMPAVALTDHGNMFGAFKFVAEASKYNVKPIVGCEFYMVDDRHQKTFTKENKDHRYHQLLLAKDAEGYKNLSKLCSLGYIEGLYSKWPRVDKELILKYHKGLIATTCCIGAIVPQTILQKTEDEAEKEFKWWLDLFGEDYYIELQRHQMDEQDKVNEVLLRFAKKYDVKTIATNDSHYVDQEDYNAHDILLCVNTGENQSKPVWKGDGFGGKDYRFGFPNDQFYFKTGQEMGALFHDVPEALDNTNEIVDKIEPLQLKRDILLPNFPIPAPFGDADDYLRHLTYEGARTAQRYGEVSQEVQERIDHELHIIKTMGFAGYFLITADLINAGKGMGVFVGPGRGSAAGSVVAYAMGITNIDPIKYKLLFERFLNPERISMPDIDTDFDDDGRQKVIDYVVDKYGKNQVAQIITYGTMAAKMAIKDVARVTELPLSEANMLAKLVPERAGIKLADAFKEVKELKEIYEGKGKLGDTLRLAEKLEGSVRGSGIHAAGIIIAPDDITNYIPVSTSKDSELLITQFDGKVVEDAGMLKMDFLGLKTLSIIKDALKMIRKNKGVDINIDDIDLTDAKTFELYQKGDTVGTFQFESPGMRKHLQSLKPTDIEDLIAMNALYRPGPMQFIENFIARKHGREEVEYPHDLLEPILAYSYGIMVYQEQIMQTAQILAGYSLGQADILRRAMGKKKPEEMMKQSQIFVDGAKEKHDIPKEKAEEVFTIMLKFAEYGFNRSHSAAYSVVAFQTAFLKANYPAEYMASVLTHNQNNIEKITFFMDECKRMGIEVLGPSVNESNMYFDVNDKDQIRFGLGAIKGTGEAAVVSIIDERDEHGPFRDIFDFGKRVNLRAVNKKTFESLAYAGAFDSFEDAHRAQYFHTTDSDQSLLEKVVKYGNTIQSEANAAQHSLFGGDSGVSIAPPKIAECAPWSDLVKLRFEKDVVGFYISGHPLDQFRVEIENFCTCTVDQLDRHHRQDVSVAGIVTKTAARTTKNGNPFGIFTVEDYNGSLEIAMFGEEYMKNQHMIQTGAFLYIKGKMEEDRRNPGQFQLRPSLLSLLSEVREKQTRSLAITLNADLLDATVLEDLDTVINAHPGQCNLEVSLYSQSGDRPLSVDLYSRKIKVSPDPELLKALEVSEGVSYKLI